MRFTKRIRSSELLVETLEPLILMSAGVTELEAFHRDGQTFLTWQEDTTLVGEQYHVYRSDQRITADNIGQAELLTGKWGPLDDNTSRHQLAGEGTPQNFVINDLGSALSDDTGLFVYTTQDGEEGSAFYAVTLVANGTEQSLAASGDSTDSAVQESVADTTPILVNSINGGKGRVYTQFMDYKDWNPTFQGYAYNYAIALPGDYDPSQSYSLKVELHAYSTGHRFLSESEFDWPAIQLFVDDPGGDRGTVHTWWYGFAADHNYNTDGPIPTSGVIENFTEQRVLKAIDEVIANSDFNVDTARVHAFGHSMGGSGALSLGIHYGDVFSGVYSSEGITNYATSPNFQLEFEQLWGSQNSNLLIVNNGEHAGTIAKYGAGQSQQTGVWDWLDHGEQLVRRRGENISFLAFGHGKADTTIDWATQGQPFIAQVEAANIGYSAEQRGDYGHAWMGFGFAPISLFGTGINGLGNWAFRNDISFLGIENATGSGDLVPLPGGTDFYNQVIDWATPWNAFDDSIVDTPARYEVSVRSLIDTQTADLTPRNLQSFSVNPGDVVTWQNVDNQTGQVLQQGQLAADADGLLTVRDFTVLSGQGSRMIMTVSSTAPPVTPPISEPPVTPPSPPVDVTPPTEPVDVAPEPPVDVSPPPVETVEPVVPAPEPQSVEPQPPEPIVPEPPVDQTTQPAPLDIVPPELPVPEPNVSGNETNESVETPDADDRESDIPTVDAQEPDALDPNFPPALPVTPGADQDAFSTGELLVETADGRCTSTAQYVAENQTAQSNSVATSEAGERVSAMVLTNAPVVLEQSGGSSTAAVAVTGSQANGTQMSDMESLLEQRMTVTEDAVLSDLPGPGSVAAQQGVLAVSASPVGQQSPLLFFNTSSAADISTAILELTQLNSAYANSPARIGLYALAPARTAHTGNIGFSNMGFVDNRMGGGIGLDLTSDFGHGPNGLIDSHVLDGFKFNSARIRFDITEAARAWSTGRIANRGLALVMLDGFNTEYQFASSQALDPASRPAIMIRHRQ
ncbi:MAG: alpha/beta hydrolase-fold protein [Planctomycetaceae bacterium]